MPDLDLRIFAFEQSEAAEIGSKSALQRGEMDFSCECECLFSTPRLRTDFN